MTPDTQRRNIKTIRILGISFFNDTLDAAISQIIRGGLVIAPSGPGLAEIKWNSNYFAALQNADTVLIDSGLLAITWYLRTGQKIKRISGLSLMKSLLENSSFRDGQKHLWVMPNEKESSINLKYLASIGIEISQERCYLAPYYRADEKITDSDLLNRIEKLRPEFVVINIAGGKQEILGAWLSEKLTYQPTIICTGAAIAFLTGQQAEIGDLADKLLLGWLKRIVSEPSKYFIRYVKAIMLVPLVIKYQSNSPI